MDPLLFDWKHHSIFTELFLCDFWHLWSLSQHVSRLVDRNAELSSSLGVFDAGILVEVY